MTFNLRYNIMESKILRHGFTHKNIHKNSKLPFQVKNDISTTVFHFNVDYS